jgi:hypothetical protein
VSGLTFFTVWAPGRRPDHGTTLCYSDERPADVALAESLVRWSRAGAVPRIVRDEGVTGLGADGERVVLRHDVGGRE